VGFDFPVAKSIRLKVPKNISIYDWDGKKIYFPFESSVQDTLMVNVLIHTAKKMSQESGFVYLMFLNFAFLDLAKSWICNTKSLGLDTHKQTIFITSNYITTRNLLTFDPGIYIFTFPSFWGEAASFGSYAYYNVVLDRMKVQNTLIQNGVSIFIIEADQVWLGDPLPNIREGFQNGDLVVVHEGMYGKLKQFCGGFYGVKSTEKIRTFFEKYLFDYARSLHAYDGRDPPIGVFHDDQIVLTEKAHEEEIMFDFLENCTYVTGLWYLKKSSVQSDEVCPTSEVKVVHNNYIIGTEAKVDRAKQFDHWFLNSKGMCLKW